MLAQSETVYMNALAQRDGLFFQKFSSTPFPRDARGRGHIQDRKHDGPWIFFHPDGQVESRYAFKEGKPDGPWVLFDPNGNTIPERSGTYRNGALVD